MTYCSKVYPENNLIILKKFLISVLNLDIKEEECDIRLNDKELTVTNRNEKNKIVDILLTINYSIILNI